MSAEKQSGCDLAIEAHEMLAADSEENFKSNGITVEKAEDNGYIKITRVNVENNDGEKQLGKPKGKYVTIEMPARFYGQQEIYEKMCIACSKELKKFTDEVLKSKDELVLVIGLGNRRITADSLGPKAISSLMVTRHLKNLIPHEIDEGIRPVCAISPGVLGTTGIETEEIIHSLVAQLKPKLVILIDALCSGHIERINTTIQITDTGITPGGGVGNKRKTINREVLGIPVVAVGVPTVVDAAAIANEGIKIATDCNDENFDNKRDEITSAVYEKFGNLIVAPKDVDSITDDISSVIANGINIALHEGITFSDIDRYV